MVCKEEGGTSDGGRRKQFGCGDPWGNPRYLGAPPSGHILHAVTPSLAVRYVRIGHVQLSKLAIPSRPPVSAPEGHAWQLANAMAPFVGARTDSLRYEFRGCQIEANALFSLFPLLCHLVVVVFSRRTLLVLTSIPIKALSLSISLPCTHTPTHPHTHTHRPSGLYMYIHLCLPLSEPFQAILTGRAP